jgi:O-antigen/teichoic acid export membrane protein
VRCDLVDVAKSGRLAVKVISGGMILSAGNLACSAISAMGSIVVARMLGPADYGVVGIALIYPMMLSGLADLGLSTAITRYASLSDLHGALTALWLRVIASAAFAMALALLAPYMAASLQRPYLTHMIQLLAIYAFASGALASVTAFLAGVNRYRDLALINLVTAVVRVSSSIALILAGYGVYGAVWGLSIGYSLAAIYAFVKLASSASPAPNFARPALMGVLGYSLPLYVPGLIGIPLSQLYNILRAVYVTDVEVGNFQIASNLLTPISVATGSLSTALFTTLPQLVNRDYELRNAVNKAARYTAIVIAPIATALALFSKQVVYVVYGPKYELAPLYLLIMAFSSLLAPFGVVTMYLNIIGATKATMMLNVIGLAMGLPITWILLVHYGMLGAVVASLVGSALSAALSLIIVERRYGVKVEVSRVVRYWLPPLAASAPAYTAMCAIRDQWLALGIGLATYLASLAALTALAASTKDLVDLADIGGGIKYVGPLINRTLNVVIKVKTMLRAQRWLQRSCRRGARAVQSNRRKT